jgi:hypothetical protein
MHALSHAGAPRYQYRDTEPHDEVEKEARDSEQTVNNKRSVDRGWDFVSEKCPGSSAFFGVLSSAAPNTEARTGNRAPVTNKNPTAVHSWRHSARRYLERPI